jgi:protoporphyrinogen oxidase
MTLRKKHICVIGGGISGIACAHTLVRSLKGMGSATRVTLLEVTDRLGGQIFTKHFEVGSSNVIIEAGAEGFVARSEVFPGLATSAGLPERAVISQARICDNELRRLGSFKWEIVPLAPGVAAQKLGFQVPEKNRGRGIKSFSSGMGQLVRELKRSLPDVRLEQSVQSINMDRMRGVFNIESTTADNIEADAVVLAVPLSEVERMVPHVDDMVASVPGVDHHSHVSVHLLAKMKADLCPQSFSIPEELQGEFHGLRAVALMNEKFPGRCAHNEWLFRFYYRPSHHSLVDRAQFWSDASQGALRNIFGIDTVIWSHVSAWKEALPIISPAHIKRCEEYQRELDHAFNGRLKLIGSEMHGAGLDCAARSGVDAAHAILRTI